MGQKPLIWSVLIHCLVLGVAFFMPLPQPPLKKPALPMEVSLVQRSLPKPARQRIKSSPPVRKRATPSVKPVVKPPVKTKRVTPSVELIKPPPPPPPPVVPVPSPSSVKLSKASLTLPKKVKLAEKPKQDLRPKPKPKPKPLPKIATQVEPVKKAKPDKRERVKTSEKRSPEPIEEKPAVLDFSEAIAKLQENPLTDMQTSFSAQEGKPRADSRTIMIWQGGIQNKIYNNWNKPAGLPNESRLAVTVLVQVAPDGTLTKPQVSRSSGSVVFDRSVLRAVRKTTTVKRPPEGCPECRELEITFRPERE